MNYIYIVIQKKYGFKQVGLQRTEVVERLFQQETLADKRRQAGW
jgi:hypothetical protein